MYFTFWTCLLTFCILYGLIIRIFSPKEDSEIIRLSSLSISSAASALWSLSLILTQNSQKYMNLQYVLQASHLFDVGELSLSILLLHTERAKLHDKNNLRVLVKRQPE